MSRRKVLFVVLLVALLSMTFACSLTPGDPENGEDILTALEDTEDLLDALDPCGNRGECSSNPDCPNYCE